MQYRINQLRFVNYVFYFVIALFAASFSILSDLDEESIDNNFFDGPVLTCNNTLLPGTDPRLVDNRVENTGTDTFAPGINTFDRSYLSSHYSDTTGLNSDVPCVLALPFANIVLNSIVLNTIDQYLPKLNVIKTIFVPPRA